MDQRLTGIFASVSANELGAVAAAVLGIDAAQPNGVAFSEIATPHADPRSIGIVRVTGTARVDGVERPWSTVTKLIDMAMPNVLGTPVDPRNEVLVYERRYFEGGRGGLRPARCFHISRPSETLTILWLEDLTGAKGPPFSLDELSEMARDLGQWNAHTAAHPPELDFPIGRDFHVRSGEGFDFAGRVRAMLAMRDTQMMREMFARSEPEIAAEFVSSYLELVEQSKTLPHVLSLADCPVSNFFYLPGETIAIDWAGLGSEPVGADGGRFIGSATTWGRGFAEIARSERELFERYLEGMRQGGAAEERDVIRAGYLSEMGFYLSAGLTLPSIFASPKAGLSLEYFEKRYEMPAAALGPAHAEIVDLVPSYIDEIRILLGRLK